MELVFPSLLGLLLAILAIVWITAGTSRQFIFSLVFILLLAAMANHISMFSGEYKGPDWLKIDIEFIPYILVGTVILLSGFYLTYMIGIRRGGLSALPTPAKVPPPDTATNVVTEAINQGMRAVGLANAGTPSKNLISANPSLAQERPPANLQRMAESRLAYQV